MGTESEQPTKYTPTQFIISHYFVTFFHFSFSYWSLFIFTFFIYYLMNESTYDTAEFLEAKTWSPQTDKQPDFNCNVGNVLFLLLLNFSF